MTIQRKSVTVRQLIEGFRDLGEAGVFSMNNKLTIRPSYQREFKYEGKLQHNVIDSIVEGYPLGVMYWAKNKKGESDFMFECLDGQQRILSICYYCANKFMYKDRYFKNIDETEQKVILDYVLDVYLILDASTTERHKWFERINIAGVKLTAQELRNAIFAGPFVTDARLKFSKTSCAAATMSKDYVTGTPINQDLLETAMEWKAAEEGKASLEEYMGTHQWDENCNDLWAYYQRVINWAKENFDSAKGITDKQNWGELYEAHKDERLSKTVLAAYMSDLIQDDDVTKHSGIIPYILAGRTTEAEKFLNIRAFTDNQKRKKLAEQGGKCAICEKQITLAEAEGDHITPWSEGGHTSMDNLQILCRKCNREKSDK